MSSLNRMFTLLFACFVIIQPGCDRQSAAEKLEIRFEEMKSATDDFCAVMGEITDPASAEAMLPKLEESHQRLAIASNELDLAEETSSRAARNIKIEIAEFKEEQRAVLKKEFERLKSDKFVKAILEPFLRRINAF
jgi:hypothetical protein